MSLKSGTYFVKNVSTQAYIVPTEKFQGKDAALTLKIGDQQVPKEAKIVVKHDPETGLYSFQSFFTQFYINDSGNTFWGWRASEWRAGEYKWSVNQAAPGMYTLRTENLSLFAYDARPVSPDSGDTRSLGVVALTGQPQESSEYWQFIAAA